jgi:dihydrofolate reductase
MRRLVVFNWVSIDGFFAGPMGEIDWMIRDPEVEGAVRETGAENSPAESAGSDTMLLGSVTYALFENTWPHIARDPNAPEAMHRMADEVNRMTKLVFSRTRKEVTWDNSVLFGGNLVEEVEKLKRADGSPILIFGSGTIVQQLTDAGLIDEYFLAVTPVVLGRGKPLFGSVQKRNMQLLDARHFKSGNVLLRYKPAPL